ncbi:MAG TPA: tripartite tricarboxylate transporter substrate-binding protein [Candidatus Sulfotelmatobacter sp.]|nr:tripartite tricarboxylate transporter substrate-binding protein [Candidatus Sulfotelmatobacter sp.]
MPALGSIPHFVGFELSKMLKVELVAAPYRGSAAALIDIISGQLPLGMMPLSDALEKHKAGLVRIIATMSSTRSPFVPDVETLIEAGFRIEADAWFGLWAPAKTPPEIIEPIHKAVVAALATPEAHERFMKLGLILTGTDGPTLARLGQNMVNQWATTIKATGFTIDD